MPSKTPSDLPSAVSSTATTGLPDPFLTKADLQNEIAQQNYVSGNYGPIQDWNISLITNLDYLFDGNTNFNENISGWDVSAVTSFEGTFRGAIAFNQVCFFKIAMWTSPLRSLWWPYPSNLFP